MKSFLESTGIRVKEETNYIFKMEKYKDIKIVINNDFLQFSVLEDGTKSITGMVNYPKYQEIYKKEIYFNDRKSFQSKISEGAVTILQLFQWAEEILNESNVEE